MEVTRAKPASPIDLKHTEKEFHHVYRIDP